MSLEKQFDFKKLEHSIYKNWEESGCFKPVKNSDTYCIMMPPPNVTGSLHMGHALTFTIQDILIRYNRMKGKEVLWQAGTDHAGIATQMVVERELQRKNIDRKDLGREKFIEKVWEWKKVSGDKISNQLRRLGSSADWSRERFTMDEGLSTAVKKVFVELYNDNIIYKDKRLVNWDPKLLTAVSDLEVDQREQEGHLWHIKYPIDNDNFITVATTRPETMLGDTAVAVHPKDERYKKYIGQHCNLPLTDRKVEIIGDEYADPEKGSGAVKITPAHDFNDFEIGKKNNLEFINIFDKQAKLNENVPNRFQGMDRYEARNKILKELKSLDLLIKEENQIMVVPYGDRSGVVIEPWLTDQWFCDAKRLSIDPIKSVKNEKTKFVPKQWEKTFFNWMENIQPWCISRQLWWGHQIPAWYGPDRKVFVALSKEEATKQAITFYKKETKLTQEVDVLDTWFSSALWTFSTLDWPKKSYELERFYPGNVLVTGFDIIFFWVARMMMMGSYFMKETPFKEVYIHPLIRDEKGQKMSKSKGNIIDPLELLDKYGADTLRFTLTALLNPGRDVKLSESRIKGYKSFTNKIWNAANFLFLNDCKFDNNLNTSSIQHSLNQWIINELSLTFKLIQEYISKYLFHEIANVMYHFIWHTYCDWYIEFAKIHFQNSSKETEETKKVAIWVFVQILKMAHPIMPFITERLWSFINKDSSFLMNELFTKFQINNQFNASQIYFKKLIQVISTVRNFRSELNVPYKELIDINFSNNDKDFIKFLHSYENELKRLLKLNRISFEEKSNKIIGAAYLVVEKTTLTIPLKNIVDAKKEIEKLQIKKQKEISNFNKLENKLKNSAFMNNASEEVIEKFKKQSIDIKSSIEKIDQIIDTINR
ncbi:MAG: valine--tRNA ligase [Pelagibacteraceae bacterium]|jgi:valyl-tRNA synthetase|nr:valine--tRNA ligase [Pelagibacteraceae bacterium]HJO13266.1 valine--tRNA ligase [Alphaproteobacteria bacterium]MBO6466732.1 valine--tRNA ligase [Pelagibacteraceae bacterium]MBO6467731.1 valine--tRNA ligase [Pelagibacteraceae bacterium]MBO6469461.1 valine--tRNA ligase [Pelagibacteraceae bacterium]|tara:strand:- start:263 stop:2899 length:2637 start_codon:yes stop_codon:yes gene_type:complete